MEWKESEIDLIMKSTPRQIGKSWQTRVPCDRMLLRRQEE
jgi:hypothetical protein